MKAWILPLSNSCAVPDLRFGLSWRSIPAERVLEFSFREDAFLLTEDKDFGELTYRLKKPNHGILLIRLIHLTGEVKAPLVLEVLRENGNQLLQCFSVLDEGKLRIKPYQ